MLSAGLALLASAAVRRRGQNIHRRPAPPTPQPPSRPHPRQDLHRFVNGLNVRYNIGISIPDPALDLVQRRDAATAAARLYTRLESHFYIGRVQDLTALLRDFDQQAKAFWSKWAGFANSSVRSSEVDPNEAPSSTQPKRRADAELGDANKRTKADPIRDLTASSVFRARPAGASAPRPTVVAASTRIQSFQSTTSASTTATSFRSAIFSANGDPPVATQDTIEASSQELRRPDVNPSRPFSQDSLVGAPSSATQEALHISFTEFEARRPVASLFALQPHQDKPEAAVRTESKSGIYDLLRRIWRMFSDYKIVRVV